MPAIVTPWVGVLPARALYNPRTARRVFRWIYEPTLDPLPMCQGMSLSPSGVGQKTLLNVTSNDKDPCAGPITCCAA